MSTTVFYPANPKFQPSASDSFVEGDLRAGRSFEYEFLKACRKVGRTEKLGDRRNNKPSCDHYAVFSPVPPLPEMLTFFECKSTGCANLPLVDIKPHQLEAMARYDHAFKGAYAGFVIHYRGRKREEEVWYMPGKAVHEYVDCFSEARYLPTSFVRERGLPIRISETDSGLWLRERLDIRDFLMRLSQT